MVTVHIDIRPEGPNLLSSPCNVSPILFGESNKTSSSSNPSWFCGTARVYVRIKCIEQVIFSTSFWFTNTFLVLDRDWEASQCTPGSSFDRFWWGSERSEKCLVLDKCFDWRWGKEVEASFDCWKMLCHTIKSFFKFKRDCFYLQQYSHLCIVLWMYHIDRGLQSIYLYVFHLFWPT